ncbi:hypothetical protein TREMEDRAFT_36663 [Tremella mesenterica DSM 1558]|uniref:uncharacterized protein n=1 Tax=Tremella mesenterica (strain ATCC 24925 / CBS 8224 / DSM 1558 / NBRC 9311 / NRRL Y-6157 / RJB 2259-6 / UBC 559-6) TaxID=578456 RepID=UPI0003F49D4D|nr:uncharacterized protein TREMEDRAFT_36663 [Tremella mesenterica DSM 1558]EIW72384.1 hypothetical protein TREMEDRAFT_36663 [Tremella mesenterica DSM 1558]
MSSTAETTIRGVLFDMDGTLIESTPAVLATWEYFAQEYNLDLHEVLKTSHGVRTIDNLRKWCGLTDQQGLEEATDFFEGMIVTEAKRLQSEGKTGLVVLPGVNEFLSVLQQSSNPLYAVVTSATNTYASAALPTAGIPIPPTFVTANDVTKGKPHPEPYLKGAEMLGLDPTDCLVVEDAPSGVKAGVAAGCKVLGLCTSHTRTQMEHAGANWVVQDLSKVKATLQDGIVHLDIDQS